MTIYRVSTPHLEFYLQHESPNVVTVAADISAICGVDLDLVSVEAVSNRTIGLQEAARAIKALYRVIP